MNRRGYGTLLHHLYQKPTHTDGYLRKDSNLDPVQKRGICKFLTHRALRIYEINHMSEDLRHLGKVSKANGYSSKEI